MASRRTQLAQRRRAAGFSQERLAETLGVDRSTIVRWEAGDTDPHPWMRLKLAQALGVASEDLEHLLTTEVSEFAISGQNGDTLTGQQGSFKTDDMPRRELLRLLSVAGTVVASRLDWQTEATDSQHRLTSVLDEYATFNNHLWRVFTMSRTKNAAYPLVREQLDVLVSTLREARTAQMRHRLCELASDLFQLAGEIFFDGNQYTSAAHCYTLAAQAAKEADSRDLWACSLTRHAFISVYEQQLGDTTPLLEVAAGLARGGDKTLSTRYWVSAVQAEVFAGLGDEPACERALDEAEKVRELAGNLQNGGWLRFDGSRLAEQRGTCYVSLGLTDRAEEALTEALQLNPSLRRRGGILVDLATLGAQRRDSEQIIAYATAALETARQSASGVVARKLHGLQAHLIPLVSDRRIRQLNQEIAASVGLKRHHPLDRPPKGVHTLTTESGRIFREAWIAGVKKYYPGEPKAGYVAPWEETAEWERASAAAVYDQVRAFVEATDGQTDKLTRAQKGRFVALCWIGQMYKHIPDPKPSYVTDWDNLPEWQRETDTDIFEQIERLERR